MPDEKQPFGCAPVSASSAEHRASAQDAPTGPWVKYQQRAAAVEAAAGDPWAAFPEVQEDGHAAPSTLQPAPAPRRFKPLEEYRFEDCVFYMGYFH